MPSEPLVGTYARYKRGTSELLQWLSESAAKASPQPASSAKKPPKKASSSSSTTATKRIPISSLIPLANQIIRSTNPLIPITDRIRNIAKDTINGRKACATWYAEFSATQEGRVAEALLESNRTHQHFLAVLEEVYEILRVEARKRRPKRKKKEPEMAADTGDLGNMFRYLELQETVSDDEDAPAATTQAANAKPPPPKQKTPEPEYELEEKDALGDDLFAIYCLFEDLANVRAQHRRAWEDYKAGKLHFVSVCRVSEDAMRLSSVLANDFHREHPHLKDFEAIVDRIGRNGYVLSALVSREVTSQSKEAERLARDPAMQHRAAFTHMPAWSTLRDVAGLANEYYRDPERKLRPVLVFPGHPFAQALLNIMGDMFEAHNLNSRSSCRGRSLLAHGGEYYMMLLLFLVEERFSTKLIASTSIYLDIYELLDGDLGRALRTCTPILRQLKDSTDSFSQWKGRLDPYGTGHFGSDDLVDSIHTIRTDRRKEGQDGWEFRLARRKKSQKVEDFATFVPLSMLEALPLTVASGTWDALFSAQSVGISYANGTNTLLAAGHVLNAVQIQQRSSISWPDLEFAMKREEKAKPLVRAGDGSIRSAARQYTIALGMPVHEASRKHHPKLHGARASARKSLRLVRQSYVEDSIDVTTAIFESGDLVDMRKLYNVIKLYHTEGPGIQDRAILEQWEATKKLTPSQVLQIFSEIAVEHEPYLFFNYLRLVQECHKMLRMATDTYLVHTLSKPVTYRQRRDMYMYEVVYDLLWNAAGQEIREVDTHSPLAQIANVMVGMLSTGEGDVCVKALVEDLTHRHLASQAAGLLYSRLAVMSLKEQHQHKSPVMACTDIHRFTTARLIETVVPCALGLRESLIEGEAEESTLMVLKNNINSILRDKQHPVQVNEITWMRGHPLTIRWRPDTSPRTNARQLAGNEENAVLARAKDTAREMIASLAAGGVSMVEPATIKTLQEVQPDGTYLAKIDGIELKVTMD